MKYEIKTLTNEDFDLLPYSRARESVGVTDRLLGISYIRDTGDVDYDVDTVLHEIQEMENKISPYGWSHEDKYGVRYKSWFQKTFIPESKSSIGAILGTGLGMALAPFTGGTSLAFLNPATLGTLGGGIGGYQEGGGVGSTLMGGLKGFGVGSIGSGLGAMAGPATGLKGNVGEFWQGVQQPAKTVGGWAGNLTKGLSGAGVSTPTSTIGGTPISTAGNLTYSGGTPYSIGGAAVPTGGNLTGSSSAINAALKSGANLGGGGGGIPLSSSLSQFNVGSDIGAGLNMGQTAKAPTSVFSNFLPSNKSGDINLGKMATGAALSGIGQTMGPQTPEVPTSRFATMMEQGGLQPRTAIGQQAMQKASELLAQNPQGLSEEYKNAIMADFDKQDEAEINVLKQNYKSLRPYADIENDSAYNKDLTDLKQEQQEYRKNTLAKLEQANEESNKAFQRQDIMNAMGIDEQTFNEYASLANQDLNTIMMQTGIDYGQAQQFKDMFGKLGGMFISSGLGTDRSSLSDFVTSNGGIMN